MTRFALSQPLWARFDIHLCRLLQIYKFVPPHRQDSQLRHFGSQAHFTVDVAVLHELQHADLHAVSDGAQRQPQARCGFAFSVSGIDLQKSPGFSWSFLSPGQNSMQPGCSGRHVNRQLQLVPQCLQRHAIQKDFLLFTQHGSTI